MDTISVSAILAFLAKAWLLTAVANACCLFYVVRRWQAHVRSLHADGQHSGMYFVDSASFAALPYEVSHSPLAKLGTHSSGLTYFDVLYCLMLQSLPVISVVPFAMYLWCIVVGLTVPKQTASI